jgi:hypothetical protein
VKRALPGVVVALAVALAGCGGSQKTVTVTQQASASVVSATSSTAGVSTGNPITSQATTPTTTAAPPPVHVSTFESPSGNIGCIIAGGVARCDIKQRNWSPPARPSSCPNIVDFGQGLEVSSSGAGRFVCAGDTALDPAAAKLAYGLSTVVGQITCTSATTGMTCKNSSGGGFFISIQSYREF